MTLVTYDLNAGPEGATLTTANSGASLINFNGGTGVYAAAAAASGAFGARVTNVAGSDAVVRFPLNATSNLLSTSAWIRVSTVAGLYTPLTFRHASGTVCQIVRTAAGALEFWKATTDGTPITLLTAGQATPGAYFRVTARLNSSTGTYNLRIYSAAGELLNEVSASGVTFGSTNPFSHVQLGANGAAARTVDFDRVQVDDGSTTEIPVAVNQPPNVTVTGNQNVSPGANVTATATASDPDGSIASYAWSVVAATSSATPALNNVNTPTVGLVAPSAGHLVTLQCVVTDNEGATTTVTTEVRVPLSGDATTLPISGTGATWTNVGAATGGAALGDTDDATYAQSPAFASTPSARRYRLQPMTARTALQLPVRLSLTAAGAATLLARLYEGGTLRQQWTLTPGISVATQTLDVTDPSAISDWGNLWVEFSVAT